MGLTKPRAAQIFNLDYKQSTRVVTVVNVVLTGGAPSLVDGVSLVKGDRILLLGRPQAVKTEFTRSVLWARAATEPGYVPKTVIRQEKLKPA